MGVFDKIAGFFEDIFGAIGDALSWLLGVPDADDYAGQLINKNSNVANLPVVYGRRLIGGTRVFVSTGGNNKNEYMYIVLALSEGEIQAINSVYVNDKLMIGTPVPAKPYRKVTGGDYKDIIWYQTFTGTDDQTACTTLFNDIGSGPDDFWGVNHRLRGVAYIAMVVKYHQDKGMTSIPEIRCEIQGRKVYDPRTETTVWTSNPALCLRDYLTNERFGKGLPDSAIDDEAFGAAATFCDSTVSSYTGGPSINTFSLNMILDTGNTLFDNTKRFLLAMRGIMPYSEGKYSLIIDKDDASVGTIDESICTRDITIKSVNKNTKLNQVKAVFVNPYKRYEQDSVIWPPADSLEESTFLAEDNNQVLSKDLTLDTVTNFYQARELARVAVLASRSSSIICELVCTSEALKYAVGDIITLEQPSMGWVGPAAKEFRILSIQLAVSGEVGLTLQEYDSSIYPWVTGSEQDDQPETTLPNPNSVDAITTASVSTGSQVLNDGTIQYFADLTWTPPSDELIQDYVVKINKKVGSVTTENVETITTINNKARYILTDTNAQYGYSIQARNGAQVTSEPFTVAPVAVVTDTTAPAPIQSGTISAVEGLEVIAISWTNPTDPDFDLVNIKVSDTTAEPTEVFAQVRSNTFVHEVNEYNKTKYYWLATVDTSGNISAYTSAGPFSTGQPDYNDLTNTPTIPTIPEVAGTFYISLGDSDAPTDTEFNTAVGRDPLENDFVIVSYPDGTGTSTKGYNYNGDPLAWTEVTEYIDGSMIVTGSLSASDITTGTLNANDVTISNLTITSGQLPSDVVYDNDITDFVTQTDINNSIDDADATFPANGLKYYYALNYIYNGQVKEAVNDSYIDVLTDGTTTYSSSTDSISGRSFEKSGNGGIEILTDAQSDSLEVGGFAYSLWFKSTTASGTSDARILTRDASDYFAITVNQLQGFPQDLTFYGEPSAQTVSDAILQDTWHHLVLNCNGTTIDYYLDGVKVVDAIGYTGTNAQRSVIIGDNSEIGIYYGSSPCDGKWSEIRVYDRELTKAEVLGLYKFPSGTNPADQIFEDAISEFITGGDVNSNVTSISGGVIQTGTAITVGTGDNVAILSGADTTYRLWAGNATASSAPFAVTQTGILSATGAIIDGNITANSLDVENATVTGTFVAPIGWSNNIYSGVINRGNLNESVKDLIDERIAEVTGGISGDFGQDDGYFSHIAQGNPDPDDPIVLNITHETGKNLTVELSGSRSWNREFIGLPETDMGVSITLERSPSGANTWTTLTTLTDSGSSINTTGPTPVHSSIYAYSISIYHVLTDDQASGNYDYRARTTIAGAAYTVSIPLQLTVVEPATVGAGNADTLDNQDGTYYLNYNNFTNTPTLITQSDIDTAISNLVDSAPTTLDTLNELANALGDDPNFATTVSTSLGNKADKAGDTYTGTITQSYDSTVWSHSEATHRPLSKKIYSETGITSATTGANITDVYGESDLSAIDNDETFTYADAWDAVESHGGRLPTLAEVMDGVGEGSGQGYDSEYIWTCTPAGAHHVWVIKGDYASYGDKKIVDITDPLEVYRTRCFFDVSRNGRQVHYSHDGKIYIQNAEVTSGKISNWDTAYGWGDHDGLYALGATPATQITNLDDTNLKTGMYDVATQATSHPDAGSSYTLSHIVGGATGSASQFAIKSNNNTDEEVYIRHRQADGTWNDWVEVWHSGKFSNNSSNWDSAYTYSQVGHLPLSGGTLTGNLQVNDYIRVDRTNDERALVFEDSGGADTIFHTVNDSQGNYNIMLGVNGAGQSSSGGDGQSKILLTGHNQNGSVSLNAGEVLTNTGDTANYNIGLLVNSPDQTIRVGNPNNNVGLDTDSGTKFLDVNRNAFFESVDVNGSVVIDNARNLTNIGSITSSGHFYFDPNGYSIQFNTDGDRDTLVFYRNGVSDWQLKHNLGRHLDFVPLNGHSIVFNGASGVTSDWATGDQAFVTDGYIRCKAIVNHGEDGTGPAGIVFGTSNGSSATYADDNISLVTSGETAIHINSSQDVKIENGNFHVGGATVIDSSRNATFESIAISGVGGIKQTQGEFGIGSGGVGLHFNNSGSNVLPYSHTSNAWTSGTTDLGHPSYKFKDFHLSGTIYSTNGYRIGSTLVIDSSRNLTNIQTANVTSLRVDSTRTEYPVEVRTTNYRHGLHIYQESGTGYAPASILLQATQSGSRGQGIFHYNIQNDRMWYSGTAYNDSSNRWGVHYQSGTDPDTLDSTASISYRLLSVDNLGNVSAKNSLQINDTTVIDSDHNAILDKATIAGAVQIEPDDTYGGSNYYAIGFQGTNTANGVNKIFARSTGTDGLYICSATSRNINFRANGGTFNHFTMTASGDFQVGGTTVISASRSLVGLNDISLTSTTSSDVFARFRPSDGGAEMEFCWGGTVGQSPQIRFSDNDGDLGWTIGANDYSDNAFIIHGNSSGNPIDIEINQSYTQYNFSFRYGGHFYAQGNITAYSDARVKTNLEVIPNALEKVCKINGYTFDRTDQDLRQAGVIAQELKEVLPEVVLGDEDVGYNVAYGNITALLIEAIKELKSEIEELKNVNSN